MRIYLVFFLLSTHLLTLGQGRLLSKEAEISILTCGPGVELYSAFGHSAFRVRDEVNNLDLVYNYGTFDPDAPGFYLQFAMSRAQYRLRAYGFSAFLKEYAIENRWVTGQVLALDAAARQAVFDLLSINAQPQNAAYRYDYFYDNCSSKIREVLAKVLGDKITFHDDYLSHRYTRRELVRQYVGDNSWGSLAIQVALGAVIDRKITAEECGFLPDYIFESFGAATIDNGGGSKHIVKAEVEILPGGSHAYKTGYSSPLLVFSLMGILVFWSTLREYRKKVRNRWVDFLVLFSTGLVGVLLLFLWLATDHSAAANNLDLLWGYAPNIVMAFVALKRQVPAYFRGYYLLLLSMLALLLIMWVAGVQLFSVALLPVFFLMATRYFFIWYLGYKY